MKRLISYLWFTPITLFSTFLFCLLGLLTALTTRSRRLSDFVIRSWSASLLKIIRLKLHVHNPHQVNFRDGKHYLLMCNHSSVYDIPISIVAINGSIRMLAKRELRNIPVFGYAMEKNEFPFIDRHDRHQALRDLKYAAELMRSGITLWVAPEGTRSIDGTLLPFKKGGFMMAAQMQATIVPVGIRGAHRIAAAHSLAVNCGLTTDVYIGKPIDTKDYKKSERDKLMNDVRLAISEAAELAP